MPHPSPSLGHRKLNQKRRSHTFLALHLDASMVHVDNILDDLRPKTGASGFTADRPCRKKAIENVGRHTSAGVDKLQTHETLRAIRLSANGQQATGRHLGNGVVDEVIEG